MTTLVDLLLYKALAVEPIPAEAREHLKSITKGNPNSTLSESIEVESDLELLLRASDAAPFIKEQEIDAWYRGSQHGLVRLHRLHQQSGILSDKRAGEHSKAMELLRVFRNDARRMLRKREA